MDRLVKVSALSVGIELVVDAKESRIILVSARAYEDGATVPLRGRVSVVPLRGRSSVSCVRRIIDICNHFRSHV